MRLISFLMAMTLISCAYKGVRFHSYVYKDGPDGKVQKKISYSMRVPRGFKIRWINGSHESDKLMIYPDSSIIFFSDNYRSGSYCNAKEMEKLGKQVYNDLLFKDTCSFYGKSDNGRYWKEVKIRNVVVGYSELPSNRETFEIAIKTLKIRRFP